MGLAGVSVDKLHRPRDVAKRHNAKFDNIIFSSVSMILRAGRVVGIATLSGPLEMPDRHTAKRQMEQRAVSSDTVRAIK